MICAQTTPRKAHLRPPQFGDPAYLRTYGNAVYNPGCNEPELEASRPDSTSIYENGSILISADEHAQTSVSEHGDRHSLGPPGAKTAEKQHAGLLNLDAQSRLG